MEPANYVCKTANAAGLNDISSNVYVNIVLLRKAVVKMGFKKAGKNDVRTTFPRGRPGDKYSIYRLLTLAGLFVIIGLLIVIGAQYLQYFRADQELANLENKVAEQEARQDRLQEEIERLQYVDYIEILARDRLGLVKPGEIIFQLED